MEEKNQELVAVPVQERTLRIYQPFIRCATCARNINIEKMHHGFMEKTFCNHYKAERQDPYGSDYDIEKDRKIAQHCAFYLPEVGTLADLTYIKPFDIKNDLFPIKKEHADNLKQVFSSPEEDASAVTIEE
ncbi:MAG: hypothetical protein IJH34_05955 [Romboutsia sp.]|nr:hypothetical protein [Romboutsia sp.]